jgi:HEAT repeat protein
MRALKRLVLVLLVSSVVLLVLLLFTYTGDAVQVDKTKDFIEQLQSFDWNLRAQAAEALGRIGDEHAVEPLVTALKDDDSDVRQEAAEALDRFGWQPKDESEQRLYFVAKKDWDKCVELDGETVAALIGVLRDKNPQVRRKAAEALGQIENPALKPLVATLRDDKSEVRNKASEALVAIGGLGVIQPLIAALEDKHFYTRETAAESLGKIGDECAVKPLVAALGDTYWKVRERAAEALGRIGDGYAIEPLFAMLKDEDSDVRQKAAEALDRFGWQPEDEDEQQLYFIAKKDWDRCVELNGTTVKALVNVLEDKNPQVRKKATETLVRIGGLRTVEPLIAALKHDNSDIRKEAAETLGKIGDSQAVKPLIAVLSDRNRSVREAAVEALVKIGSLHTIGPLVDALKDRDSDVREAAAEILGKTSNPALEPLIVALWDGNWEVREEAAKALGRLRDSRAVNSLIAVLKYEDSGVRQKTAEDLGKITSPMAGPFVAPLTQNIRFRIEVIKALGQIGDERAIPALVRELQCWDTAQAATDALERLNWSPQSAEDKVHFLVAKRDGNTLRQIWEQTKQVLLKDMKSDEDKIVKNALYAFIAVGKEEIIKVLIDTLNARGDRTIAEVYRNCGNEKLSSAAQDWATKYEHYISAGSGAHLVGWGSW